MKKLFLFCVGACLFCIASAQKVFFVYLQTDNQLPFYVRMSDKVYSSAVSGFLIIPNLVDSTYNLGIGFAKSTAPETRFAITIKQNDKGYLIKNFEDGLALFDVQDLSLLKSISATRNNTSYETRTDKFSATLSKAADDPGLLRVAVAKKEEPIFTKVEEKPAATTQAEKTETDKTPPINTLIDTVENKKPETEISKTDTAAISVTTVSEQSNPVVEQKSNPIEAVIYTPSVVSRRSESSTTEGFGITYFDSYDGNIDTIRILIPPSKNKFIDDSVEPKSDEKKLQLDTVINELVKANDSLVRVNEESKVMNAMCKNIASEKDFMKLRKNMAAKDNDEAMISEAKKSFRSKCFTTEQIRYLSTLFLTSAAKYQFVDSIYEYVTFKEGLKTLQSDIKDDYYLKRFKALVGE